LTIKTKHTRSAFDTQNGCSIGNIRVRGETQPHMEVKGTMLPRRIKVVILTAILSELVRFLIHALID
ncbi:MAG: hypothetical protein K0R39_4787, partial [Symbiobacteriaceae bacterium]|nr:hypothetical protein [Symbiobacteriaceae bacterium]